MPRSLPVIALCISSLAACTHAQPSARTAVGPQDPPPLRVSYSITRGGDSGTILSGQTELDGRHPANVHTTAPHNAADVDLELGTRPGIGGDGSILLALHYQEHSLDGAQITWEPQVRVARGVPARVELSGAGWTRTIEFRVE